MMHKGGVLSRNIVFMEPQQAILQAVGQTIVIQLAIIILEHQFHIKKQPAMPKLHHQKFFAEDALSQENKSLCQKGKLQGQIISICPTSQENCQKIEAQMCSKSKRWGGECSSWVLAVLMGLLIAVLVFQAHSVLVASSVRRGSFTANIHQLKQAKHMEKEHPSLSQARPAIMKPLQTNAIETNLSANTPLFEIHSINLKNNQASIENKQTTKLPSLNAPKHSLVTKSRETKPVQYIIPQNNFSPYVPIGQAMIPLEIPTLIQPEKGPTHDISSLTQQQTQMSPPLLIQNADQMSQMTFFPTFAPPSPTFTNEIQLQQFADPSQLQNTPKKDVQPTINPFNKIEEPPLYSFYYEGTLAGIKNSQLIQARTLRELLHTDPDIANKIALDQKLYYEKRYSIGKYEELPFCIVVPTFNNAIKERYLNNIKSIVMQDYSNFHVVVIDDASTDGTGALIKAYLDSQKKITTDRYQVIVNTFQRKAMPNLRTAASDYCKPEEIFLIVDGDDELVGRQVLKLFNAVFQQKKLWFVYSNFLSTNNGIGFSRPFPAETMENNHYRMYPFVTSHLRAFYTKLFLNIKEEDLKDESGEYLRAANDVAICIPILEQAHERVGYLPEITYYYNSETGLNNHFLRLNEQRENDQKIRDKANYKRLENLMD